MSVEKSIYFMRPVGQVGPIKIGCSRWPADRLTNISTWSPVPLEIIVSSPGDGKLERFLHRKFKAHRLHREWFSTSDQLLAGIAAVCSGVSVEEAFGAVRKERRSAYVGDHHYYVSSEGEPA